MKVDTVSVQAAQDLRRESKALQQYLEILRSLQKGEARVITAEEGEVANSIRNKLIRAGKALGMVELVVRRRGNQIALWRENGAEPKKSKRKTRESVLKTT